MLVDFCFLQTSVVNVLLNTTQAIYFLIKEHTSM